MNSIGTKSFFSIIACCEVGDQLTGSGYLGMEQMQRALTDREKYHASGSSRLHCIVIVRGDGQTVKMYPSIELRGKFEIQLSDRRVYQQWYRDEDGKKSNEVF